MRSFRSDRAVTFAGNVKRDSGVFYLLMGESPGHDARVARTTKRKGT